MTLNFKNIVSRTGIANEAFDLLFRYSNQPDHELVYNAWKRGNVRYQFIGAIEACIDICDHVVSGRYSRASKATYIASPCRESMKLIHAGLAARSADLQKFRSVLVHLY